MPIKYGPIIKRIPLRRLRKGRWNDDEIYKLMRLKKKGLSYKQISYELKRTISSCQAMVHNCKMRVDVVSSKMRRKNNKKIKGIIRL